MFMSLLATGLSRRAAADRVRLPPEMPSPAGTGVPCSLLVRS